MDIHSVREQLRMRSIYDIPLRVTYYARVSSESDEQLNSLGNQITYYEELIKRNKAWTFVPGYIDEGLSGISTRKREDFNRMIADAKEDTFDLIITKEISRFARNTLDSIRYTRELLGNGVGVFFQNDNINTFDDDSELRLAIMSSIAQDELRKLSSRIKFGHQQAIKSNVVLGNSRIFGYQKDNKRLVIDETEAPMVRELFELYATDEYSMKQIESIFWERGYRNRNGNKIAHTTMSGVISNPKYKGYYVGNKVKVVDMFTKKQVFLSQEEWVMFKDETGEIVPAIVSEELWDKANEILRRRSEDVKNRQGICNHANLLTGKLFCAECGKPYYRRESKSKKGVANSKWICSGKINNGADSCPSFPIYEDEIKPILFEAFRDTETDVDAILAHYTELFQRIAASDDLQSQIDNLKNKQQLIVGKQDKLLEMHVLGQLNQKTYLQMNAKCEQEIEEIDNALAELEKELLSQGEFKKRMSEITSALEEAKKAASEGIITTAFVNRYIDKILVKSISDDTANLEIKIFTGKICEKYLRKLEKRAETNEPKKRSRTGHTSKKMIESYENSIKG